MMGEKVVLQRLNRYYVPKQHQHLYIVSIGINLDIEKTLRALRSKDRLLAQHFV